MASYSPRPGQPPYAGQYNSYASSRTYADSDPRYPPSNSSTLAPHRDHYAPNYVSPQPSTERYKPPYDPAGAAYQYKQDQPPVYSGPYNSNGQPMRRDRSPSPTPSDIEAMKRPIIDWKLVLNWRTYAKVKYIPYYIALIICLVLVILMTLYHKQIVQWLKPVADWMHGFRFGWIIPIAVLFVISFPPLFGHEIVGVLCGLVWGLWVGFAIVCAGTLLGEIGNYYAFKYLCRSRGEKLEKTKSSYACLARVVREGGFKIALVARLSAIPGHFTTAIFSTCGMGIFVFTLAAILSLPKQFIVVYLGVILEHSNDTAEEKAKAKTSRLISDIVLVITTIITFAAMWWIWREMERVRPAVLRERRRAKKLAAALPTAGEDPFLNASNAELDSDSGHPPLKANEGGWGHGGGFGYSGVSQPNPGAPYGGRSREEQWEMSESRVHLQPYNNQPHQRDQTDLSDDMTPMHKRVETVPPQIPDMDLPSASRIGREGWKVKQMGSEHTVGMGSWGGILREGSDANNIDKGLPSQNSERTPTQNTFRPPVSAYPGFQPPSSPSYPGNYAQRATEPSLSPPPRKPNLLPPSNGLGAFGVTLVDPSHNPTVSVNSAHGSRKSVEMRGGHAIGRSFRASVEGGSEHVPHPETNRTHDYSHDPDDPTFHTAYTRQASEASNGTFGAKSLHSRQTATTGDESDDYRYVPPGGARF